MYGRIYIYTEIFHNCFFFLLDFFFFLLKTNYIWMQYKIQNTKQRIRFCELEGNMFSGISKNDWLCLFVRSFIESVVCTIKDVCHMPVTFNCWYGTLSSHMKFYTQLYHEQQFNERIWALPTNKTSASSNIVIVNRIYHTHQTHQYLTPFSLAQKIYSLYISFAMQNVI